MLPFTPQSADQHLSQYRRGKLDPSEAEAAAIRAALACLVDQADFITIGICAENLASAIAALTDYLKGLDVDADIEVLGEADLEAANEACYIKFNSRSQKLYGDRYPGQERGVLLATQADYDTTICGVYGHFPLDLFG